MRLVQALHWLRDLLAREGESDQVKRKLAKLFDDPKVGPPLKADLVAGMAALPTWMWVFLKPLVEGEDGDRLDDAIAPLRQKPRSQTAKGDVEGDVAKAVKA
jgi:hypothetical protein